MRWLVLALTLISCGGAAGTTEMGGTLAYTFEQCWDNLRECERDAYSSETWRACSQSFGLCLRNLNEDCGACQLAHLELDCRVVCE